MNRNIIKKIKVPESIVWQSNESGWILKDLADTIEFGKRLNQSLPDSKIFLLDGSLGSGKTSLVKGIAEDLEIKEPITSPTFSLAHHYETGKKNLIHLDLYRLEETSSANELFLQEEETANLLNALMVIEWPSRLSLPLQDSLTLKLKYWTNNRRLIQIVGSQSNEPINSSTS